MDIHKVNPYIRLATFSTLPGGHIISTRVIFDYELIFVSAGKCKITFEGTTYICEKNHAVLIPPGVNHSFEVPEGTEFVQPHIHFDLIFGEKSVETPISFKGRKDMNEYERSLISQDLLADMEIPYIFTPERIEQFKQTFFDVIGIFQGKGENRELLYKAKMLELISMILSQFESRKAEITGNSCATIENIKGYIDNNFRQIITLDTLAMQFGMNKFTLLRTFKHFYGVNIISYYKGKRLDFAKKLLCETALSVTSVSEQLNFSDIYSFSRFFKTNIGVSPQQYRKSGEK